MRELNESENNRKSAMEELLADVILQEGTTDKVCWEIEGEATFCVRGCYRFLRSMQVRVEFDVDFLLAVQQLWNTRFRLKIIVFGWRPTKL
ncbi:hypothetical protein L195_g006606 [Trifolium pratense]|uniref:Uncharacterized protein n=1 Tax=Trifolium pratense TaxID=57577 RepID=A0A2K3P445_TRIPR|nr:hypothetical protein L195_g006606 [Trifolium pratense]